MKRNNPKKYSDYKIDTDKYITLEESFIVSIKNSSNIKIKK